MKLRTRFLESGSDKLKFIGLIALTFGLLSIFVLQRLFIHAGEFDLTGVQKVSDTEGGFSATLDNTDLFGVSAAELGDLDGDGVEDLAVGASGDDDGGTGRGAVYILFMEKDGTVKSHQKISDLAGGFGGTLDNNDQFGISVSAIGDLDGDGITELAVGASGDADGGTGRGSVWILFLDDDGTVQSEQKISDTAGGFTGVLDNTDAFGIAVAGIGDLNGDTFEDIVVGANGDDDGATNTGAVWVLFLNASGTVTGHQKISATDGSVTGPLAAGSTFGSSVHVLEDLDEDGIQDIVVGAPFDGDGGTLRGAIWVMNLDDDGTVLSDQKISDTAGGFNGGLDDIDIFGWSVAGLGDIDQDGVEDIGVGAIGDSDTGTLNGALWILFMTSESGVKSFQKYNELEGDFTEDLDSLDFFGTAIANVGNLDDTRARDVIVGAQNDDDGGGDRGAIYSLFIDRFQEGVEFPTPDNIAIEVNHGDACTMYQDVTIRFSGDNIEDYVIGNDEFFVGFDWIPFEEPEMEVVWELPPGDGEKTLYFLFRSATHNQSVVMSRTVLLDRETLCGMLAEQPEPPGIGPEPGTELEPIDVIVPIIEPPELPNLPAPDGLPELPVSPPEPEKIVLQPRDTDCAPAQEIIAYAAPSSIGVRVRVIQEFLQCLGHFPEEIDSTAIYGPVTQRAVSEFQADHGLDPIGVVGPMTRELINSYLQE